VERLQAAGFPAEARELKGRIARHFRSGLARRYNEPQAQANGQPPA
jgi:hypothetical protein